MSLAAALGEASPPSSGRSSPVPRAARRAVEDGIYKVDKSLKRYATAIERALGTWEISPEEWADYIAFLGRLLKAIQSRPKDAPILPHSDAIATRLAQCLNPALPSGVHQKALEVYSYIFSSFGNDYISGHLPDFLPGLSGVLAFASLSVRPGLYSLFEDHIVALPNADVRPALKSITLAILPALEDENGDDFERAFNILLSFEQSFSPRNEDNGPAREVEGYFWQCFFLATITSPSRRQGVLNYLFRRLPKLPAGPDAGEKTRNGRPIPWDAQRIITPEPGLLIRCFVCGLLDSQILVQRGFLDLLVTHLPISSSILQEKVGKEDLDRLVSAAVQVLMRRDMSLNRRLWGWFLGPDPKESSSDGSKNPPVSGRKSSSDSETGRQLQYFSDFGRSSLERCILKMLRSPATEPSEKARPFRICLSLMDRWEIGGLLVPQVFFPAMRALFEYSQTALAKDVAEVVRSASLFFDGVEASLIWECLLGSLQEILEKGQSAENFMNLFRWIIRTFNIKDEEMLVTHIPHAVLYLLVNLDLMELTQSVQGEILISVTSLLEILPARVFAPSVSSTSDKVQKSLQDSKLVRRAILDFYHSNQRLSEKTTVPFENHTILEFSTKTTISLFSKSLIANDGETLPKVTALLLALTSKFGRTTIPKEWRLQHSLTEAFGPGQTQQDAKPYPIVQSVITLLSSVDGNNSILVSIDDVVQLEPVLTSLLWGYLSPQRPKYHVEAVKALWQLEQVISPRDEMIATLIELVNESNHQPPDPMLSASEIYRRFMILWSHSIPASNVKVGPGRRGSGASALTDAKRIRRALEVLEKPLLLVLEVLHNPEHVAFDMLKTWLQNVGSLEYIYSILLQNITRLINNEPASREATPGQKMRRILDNHLDIEYYLSHLQSLLDHGSSWTWRCLSRTLVLDMNGAEKDAMTVLCDTCMRMLFSDFGSHYSLNRRIIAVLDLVLSGPTAPELRLLELDKPLLDRLMTCVTTEQSILQGGLLRLLQLALKLRVSSTPVDINEEGQGRLSTTSKRPSIAPSSRPTTSSSSMVPNTAPPPLLFQCIITGFSSAQTRLYLEQWLAFLAEILPMFTDGIFTNLLPLVECFSRELSRVHEEIVMLSTKAGVQTAILPEIVAMCLLDGLEMVLDRAYECLMTEAKNEPTARDGESKPSFLSNVTSGVFKAEVLPARTITSNNRLTVTLALQDSIRISMKMWSWATGSTETNEFDSRSSATTAYHALKVRNKTRHLLEQIFSVETLESLEVVIAHWCFAGDDISATSALSLLHVMQATRPKNVVPAILDALCSRTNPTAISGVKHSSLTIDLTPSQVATFLSAYLNSTEDDAMDELWPDCIAFLRDVLANPLPYRQILTHLLSIMLLLSEKLSNTNFGEQRKMRRDLGDIFQRLLTATFTALPSGYIVEASTGDENVNESISATRSARVEHSMTLVPVLHRVVTKVDLLLETQERVTAAINNITTSLVSPTFRARSFPRNLDAEFLVLVLQMTRKASSSRPWKKEVLDAFNDPRILSCRFELMMNGWLPLLHQWALYDKERVPELLTRLTPPSSAGIMFGVGASAARLEADRRTQLTVRRLCLLLLASPEDTHIAHIRSIEEKLAELFEASPSSSPSSAVNAELFLLCRTLVLSITPIHLAPLWPIMNKQLQATLTSLLPSSENSSVFNNFSVLQACKLLDMLILSSPDDFQLHEWLYITDTIDAVYQPTGWGPAALCDQIAEALGADGSGDVTSGGVAMLTNSTTASGRQNFLLEDDLGIDKDDIKALPKEDFVRSVIRPFLSQLSIHAYEGTYSLDRADVGALRASVLRDVLDVRSVVE